MIFLERIRFESTAARRSSRLLKKEFSCFDELSTNGKSSTILTPAPFALSLSKGERNVFQQPASASFHLITLSALISTHCGIVSPIFFAVLRLIISSNFVGCSTGRSAGFVPLRILST